MSDIRQFLVTLSDDGVTVRRVELTVPSGMGVQLTEWERGEYVVGLLGSRMRLPLLYEERVIDNVIRHQFPVFNLGPFGETTYQTYHRGFHDGYDSVLQQLKEIGDRK